MKKLIVYYSRTGTTKKLAEKLTKKLKCDSEEIFDTKNRKGLIGWFKSGKDSFKREKTKIRPLKKKIEDYDLIIVGTPVWAWTVSSPVRTFLYENKKKIKNVAFFCTFSTDIGKTFSDMKEILGKKPISCLNLNARKVKKGDYLKDLSDFISELR